jgi:Outer membrane protein beta-barrel domain
MFSAKRTVQQNTLQIALAFFLAGCRTAARAQLYAGVLGGVASISGDARSMLSSGSSAFSSYDPKNGGAIEVLAGKHLSNYFTVQANYIWNANNMTVSGGTFIGGTQQAYQEYRSSYQLSVLGNVLVYFRNRDSRLRPYLSVGTGLLHFSSTQQRVDQALGGPVLPPHNFDSKMIALNVPVGIDVALGRGWALRYTFSENISGNPIDDHLSPSGQHSFKTFLNLFGFSKRF